MRAVFLLALALLGTLAETSAHGTQAYFTSTVAPSGTMTTVHLDVSTSSSASGLFDIASNMVPGDFEIKTIDIVNHGAAGESQQDFTYAVGSTSIGASNWCSKLDAADAPTCASPQTAAVPSAS